MLDARMIQSLGVRVADIAETYGPITLVEMGEMEDGSGRSFAVVNTSGFNYRVSSPAPMGAPKWATVYDEWRTERSGVEGWSLMDEPWEAEMMGTYDDD